MKIRNFLKKSYRVILILFILMSLLMTVMTGCFFFNKDDNSDSDDDSSDKPTEAPTIVKKDNELLGVWTAYSTKIIDDWDWEDIDFEFYGATSVELLIDGKAIVVRNGAKSFGNYRWQVAENGFTLTEKGTGSAGHGELENGIITLAIGPEGWESDYQCVKGDIETAKNMIRDKVDRSEFLGIWKMTAYKDRDGTDIDNRYIYSRGVVVNIKDDGTLDFLDIDTLYYTYVESGPEICEWTFDDGYIFFTTENGFWKNTGKLKDGAFIVAYASNYMYFEKDPKALEDVYTAFNGGVENTTEPETDEYPVIDIDGGIDIGIDSGVGIDDNVDIDFGEFDRGREAEETVMYVLANLCEETIDHFSNGMIPMYINNYEIINGEMCWKVAIGTGDEEDFSIEYVYAVGEDSRQVYRADIDAGVWIGLAMG